MVSNPNTGSPTDLLQSVGLPTDRPITKVTDEQAIELLKETGPDSSRRRSGFYVGQHRAWWVYVLQYMGFQTQQSIETLETADPRQLMIDGAYIANHILRYVSANVARKSQTRPAWSVIPNTPDLIDQSGAKVGQSLLDYAYDDLDIYRKSLERNLWLECCGTAFDYADWNEAAGQMRKVYIDPMRGTPIDSRMLSDQDKQMLDSFESFVEVTDGNWDFEVLSPFQVYLPSYAKSLEMASWMRCDRVMAYDEVWNRWPKKAKDVKPQDDWSSDTQSYWRRLATMSNRSGDVILGGAAQSEGILISKLEVRPSKWLPQGLTIEGTKTGLLTNGPYREKQRGIESRCLIDYHNIRVPGRFWSMGVVEHLVASQREYNRGRDQINRQRDTLGTPQWLAPKGALQGAVRNDYGDVWEYDPQKGVPPMLVQPPGLGPATIESTQGAMGDMQLIAAQSDPTQGQVPTGVRSGIAIRALQEKDQMVIAPSIADIEKGYERLGTRLLQLAWKMMKMPRAIAIYGESRSADIVWFKGADLAGNTKVRIRPGSMTPRSKAEAMQNIMDLVQLGVLQPQMNPAHQRLVLETMDIGGSDRLFLLESLHRRRARHENLMFAHPPQDDPNYQFPDVDADDDHAAHLEEHQEQKLTDDYEHWPPIRKILFNAHMEKHNMMLAQMLQAQVAMQQQAAGGGGSQPKQPGEASQPRERQSTPGSEPVA
jgi:hypothetical protein